MLIAVPSSEGSLLHECGVHERPQRYFPPGKYVCNCSLTIQHFDCPILMYLLHVPQKCLWRLEHHERQDAHFLLSALDGIGRIVVGISWEKR